MKFNSGVNPFGIRPELMCALFVADGVYREFGYELFVLSLNDGVHDRCSPHYSGSAADLRVSDVPFSQSLVAELKKALGENPDYNVVLEKNRILLEYQPKLRSACNS